MIVRKQRSWLSMVLAVRDSSLATTWPRVAIVTIFAILVTWSYHASEVKGYSLTTTPFTLVGLAMAIFLGFRNNESYDRFWEGRTLWGRLVNVSRSFARQCLTLIVPTSESDRMEVEAMRRRIVRATICFVHAFRHHLRDTDSVDERNQYLLDEDQHGLENHINLPNAILQRIGDLIHSAWQSGHIREYHVPILEESLTEMTTVQGACERIKNTPIPFTYSVLIHRLVAVYCFALPFGLYETVGVLTPAVVCLISHAFFGMDAIGDEVEQPFERAPNDLPLETLSRMIEINLLQMLGEKDVPEPVAAENGVFY